MVPVTTRRGNKVMCPFLKETVSCRTGRGLIHQEKALRKVKKEGDVPAMTSPLPLPGEPAEGEC